MEGVILVWKMKAPYFEKEMMSYDHENNLQKIVWAIA